MNINNIRVALMYGWLNIDKSDGITSTKALNLIKRKFNIKKIGHAGTLDPMATGILPVAIGEATKIIQYMVIQDKEYTFEVKWGTEMDTDDKTGSIIAETNNTPTIKEIMSIIPSFIGSIQQVPPKFSAIKIGGKRAYTMARNNIDCIIEARSVEVKSLNIITHNNNKTTFDILCGKGTYIRSIARDMGRLLGCLGHIVSLRRNKVGVFNEDNAIKIEDLLQKNNIDIALLPAQIILTHLQEIKISEKEAQLITNGCCIKIYGFSGLQGSNLCYTTRDNVIVAVGVIFDDVFRPKRVFNC